MSEEDRYSRMEADREAGRVVCDAFCGASDQPETLEEYKAAYEHWRRHGYLYGCSHGN